MQSDAMRHPIAEKDCVRRMPICNLSFLAVFGHAGVGRLGLDPLADVRLAAVPAAASAAVGLLFMGTFGCSFSSFLAVTAAGFLGALLDSFLGATVQVQYRRKDGSLTEKAYDEDGRRNERARGIAMIDNDMVNLISGLFSVSIASVSVLVLL